MTNNNNHIESIINEKLDHFESTFSSDEIATDWNAVSSQIGASATAGNQATQIGYTLTKTIWIKLTGALIIVSGLTLLLWPSDNMHDRHSFHSD